MKILLLFLVAIIAAIAQPPPANLVINQSNVQGGTPADCLIVNSSRRLGQGPCTAGGAVPTGPAGGDLTGTYPNPTVKASVGLTGSPTSTTATTGDGTTKIATDAFVANALQAINPATNVQVSTTAVLPNTPTYSNGTAGVGATLTAGSNTTLSAIDGYSVQLNDRILVQNQATVANNGCYTLTQVGSGSLPWKLTRCVDYNTPTNINYTGSMCTIQTGSTYAADTCFSLVALISAVGTSSITYTQQTAGANAGKPGGGVQITGNTTPGNALKVASGNSGKNIQDAGFPAANIVQASSPGAGIAHFAGSTQTVTSSKIVAGDITSTITSPAAGTSCTFVSPSTICVATGTFTGTVPVPTRGDQFCVMNDDNIATVITLSAIGSSARYENQARTAYGTAGTGTLVSGGAVKDFVCLYGLDSTHYLFASGSGTWTAN